MQCSKNHLSITSSASEKNKVEAVLLRLRP
jgi:hypothetical protein